MRRLVSCLAAALLVPAMASAQINVVETVKDDGGWKLMVDGKPMMVFGINWDYYPIGENYAWSLWQQPDDVIEDALRGEMELLRAMGINAIRQFQDMPPRWVTWVYENYGIFTVMNHTLGRYGVSVNGAWVGNTDYADKATREAILAEVKAMVEKYKDTRGVLMFMLGNENNYGLTWTSFEAEALPGEKVDAARAEPLYTLFGEAATMMKATGAKHPIAIANGDLAYMDLIVKHGKDIDIMGSNVYRGASSGDLFDRVDKEFDRPFLYSEFGADAYDAKRQQEDGEAQAEYLRHQWQEIYEHAHGNGRSGTAIGGLIFQWSDGWWKNGQSVRLSQHDTHASWSNKAYPKDWMPDGNNMNEEWFGIAAKDFGDERGVHRVRPRTAYYVLQEAFTLDPYAADTTPERIREHFARLDPLRYAFQYKADRAEARVEALERIYVDNLQLKFESVFSQGDARTTRSSDLVADHTESAYIGVAAEPIDGLRGRASFNIVGNAAANRLHDIYYESRGRDLAAVDANGDEVDLSALERIALYSAEFTIDQPWFLIEGYYRSGHYHWGDEGDFFGLYREANYGENIDIYNGKAPLGGEFHGKGALKGLKIAFGPEMYWGANPGFIAKYHRAVGKTEFTLMHHEDLGRNAASESSLAIPERQSRRTTLHFGFETGGLRFDIGGMMAGSDRVGEAFRWQEETDGRGYNDSGYLVLADEVQWIDTLGAKARLTIQEGGFQAYAHGVFKGLVADAGADYRKRFAGWTLNESGRGNQAAGMLGFAYNFGDFQIAPHALYQKPLIGPNAPIADRFSRQTGIYYPGVGPRNILDDPFAVLDNRETIAGELLLVWDPTPGTWFWEWDNTMREDARFAGSLNFVYRHQPTVRDANFGVNEFGQFFAFGGTPPARDLWEVNSRWVANPNASVRLIGHLFAGIGESNGDDDRLVERFGGDVTALLFPIELKLKMAFGDWGPYDFHRDFNLTYPFQGQAHLGYVLGLRNLFEATARFGVRGIYRTLDEHSAEYVVDPTDPNAIGTEWEIATYLHLDM